MHPMFVKLFLENDADDVLAEEEDRRRAANRARRSGRARPPGSSLVTGIAGPPVRFRRRGRTASANSEVTASRRARPGPHGTSGTTRQRTVP